MLRRSRCIGILAAHAALGHAMADPGPPSAERSLPAASADSLAVEGGLVVGLPAALPTGLSRGAGVAVSTAVRPWRLGARIAWVTATESTMTWEVTHSDVQLRLLGGFEHRAGRGRVGLRFGAGATMVHESRTRAQGARAGLSGDELATSAWALVPAGDLEVAIGVSIHGPWSLSLAGGPSLALIDGEPRGSWIAQLGLGWQP
jgi:hypothetical protein